MKQRPWLLAGASFAFALHAFASDLVCPSKPANRETMGVIITIAFDADATKCQDPGASSDYLNAFARLAESSWPLPIGWSPFPSAVVNFRFSDHGAVIDPLIVESTSFDISACGHQVLELAAQRLASQFPDCLSGLIVSADIKVPWNTIGVIDPPLEDAPVSSTTFKEGDLEAFTPTLNIQDLDSFEPGE
jgi:hypothetical protein